MQKIFYIQNVNSVSVQRNAIICQNTKNAIRTHLASPRLHLLLFILHSIFHLNFLLILSYFENSFLCHLYCVLLIFLHFINSYYPLFYLHSTTAIHVKLGLYYMSLYVIVLTSFYLLCNLSILNS